MGVTVAETFGTDIRKDRLDQEKDYKATVTRTKKDLMDVNLHHDNSPKSSLLTTSPAMSPISWREWWDDLHDKQRLERLQQCQEIQARLEACQARRKPSTMVDHDEAIIDIERIVPGLRMMKYFGWRGIHQSPENSDELNQQIKTVVSQTCAREQHAMWACRAVSIGCGTELGTLKRCFDKEGPMSVLSHPQNMYEGNVPTKIKVPVREVPCGDLQHQVGQCINNGIQELYDREQGRKIRLKGNASS